MNVRRPNHGTVAHGIVLDEANCPETGRKLVVPAWFAGQVKKSELKDASLSGDSVSIARNGRLGIIDRFEVYVSNLLPKTGANKIDKVRLRRDQG